MLDWMALRSADDYWYYDVVANSANDTQRISSSDLLAPVSKRCLMPSLMARSKPQIPTNPTLLILSASGTKSIPLGIRKGIFADYLTNSAANSPAHILATGPVIVTAKSSAMAMAISPPGM